MRWQRIALAVVIAAFLTLGGRSCIQRTKVFTAEPSTIIKNSDRFSNKVVVLNGQVINALSISGVGFYLLQDEKGSAITVSTKKGNARCRDDFKGERKGKESLANRCCKCRRR